MKKTKLPKKMSTLLLLAVKDLSKVEKRKDYRIDMNVWHSASGAVGKFGNQTKQCAVCFAGSVISNTLGLDKDKTYVPADPFGEYFSDNIEFDQETIQKLYALNFLRQGYLYDAAREMGVTLPGNFKDYRRVVQYNKRNRRRFKLQMRQIARDLKKVGL
jgi:hypothetical protein